jgi:hypothetical protein
MKIIPFPPRKLSPRAAAREPVHRQVDWNQVDQKTRRGIHKSWPGSSVAAQIWAAMEDMTK